MFVCLFVCLCFDLLLHVQKIFRRGSRSEKGAVCLIVFFWLKVAQSDFWRAEKGLLIVDLNLQVLKCFL